MILSLFSFFFHTVIPQYIKPLFNSPNLDKDLIPLSFKSMEKDLIINLTDACLRHWVAKLQESIVVTNLWKYLLFFTIGKKKKASPLWQKTYTSFI